MKKKAMKSGEASAPDAKKPRPQASGKSPVLGEPGPAGKRPADSPGSKKDKGKSKGGKAKDKDRDKDKDKHREKDKARERGKGKDKGRGKEEAKAEGTSADVGRPSKAGVKAESAAAAKHQTLFGLSEDTIRIEAFYVYEERSDRGLPGDPHGDWAEAIRRLTLGIRRH
jgi:hypothetical protein